MATAQLLQWSENLKIGIREIDEPHKALIAMVNELHQAIVARNAKDTARDILDRLADYPRTYFRDEEGLMQRSGYSALGSHREQHEDLIRRVSELREQFDTGNSKITFELMFILKAWLARHVNESDRRFGAYMMATA
jgi:hemerythrin